MIYLADKSAAMPISSSVSQVLISRPLFAHRMAVPLWVLAGLLIVPPAIAQQQVHSGSHGEHTNTAHSRSDNPAVAAYQAVSARMHEEMATALTGDPDVDFAQGMIPHHEGAIAMAEIVLEHGEDDEIRQLAEEIIAAQESEIAFLKEWLQRHGY